MCMIFTKIQQKLNQEFGSMKLKEILTNLATSQTFRALLE